jgi:hypothetical protein
MSEKDFRPGLFVSPAEGEKGEFIHRPSDEDIIPPKPATKPSLPKRVVTIEGEYSIITEFTQTSVFALSAKRAYDTSSKAIIPQKYIREAYEKGKLIPDNHHIDLHPNLKR